MDGFPLVIGRSYPTRRSRDPEDRGTEPLLRRGHTPVFVGAGSVRRSPTTRTHACFCRSRLCPAIPDVRTPQRFYERRLELRRRLSILQRVSFSPKPLRGVRPVARGTDGRWWPWPAHRLGFGHPKPVTELDAKATQATPRSLLTRPLDDTRIKTPAPKKVQSRHGST